MNNLRNIGTALLGETDTRGRFPAAGYFNVGSTIAHRSWVVGLLPRLERTDMAAAWDKELSYLDPKNAELAARTIPILVCPDDFTAVPGEGNLSYALNGGFGWTIRKKVPDCPCAFHATDRPSAQPFDLDGDGVTCPPGLDEGDRTGDKALFFQTSLFFINNWPEGAGITRAHRPNDLIDGLSNTLMATENLRTGYDAVTESNWAKPSALWSMVFISTYICKDRRCSEGNVDYRLANDRSDVAAHDEAINAGVKHPEGESPWASSGHPDGVNAVFADGHIQFLRDNIDGAVYAALASPQGSLIQGALKQAAPVTGGD